MVDFVALVTPPILVGPNDVPAEGSIFAKTTSTVALPGKLVVPFQAEGKIVAGQFQDLKGLPYKLPVTPEGVAVEIVAQIIETKPGVARSKYYISRTVAVPDQSTVTWDALVDVVPVVSGGDYILPPWAAELSEKSDAAIAAADTAATKATEATTARNEAVAAKNAAEAVGATNDTIMASVAANPSSAFAAQQNATTVALISTPGSPAQTAIAGQISEAIAAQPSVGPSPTMGSLVRALQAGRSSAFSVFGDSTGDSDGSTPSADRLAARFARRLCTKFPNHHVMMKLWNPATEAFGEWVTMQAQAAGRRHAIIGTRSLRSRAVDVAAASFASGNIDVRVLVSLPSLAPTATQFLVGRMRKEIADVLSNDLQFELRLHTSGNLYLRHSENGTAYLSDRISTVPLSSAATANTPIWIRATLEVTPGTGFVAKFYTSTDGITWTQLGANVTGGSATTVAMYPAVQGSFFEIGGSGWQPVAAAATGAKFYEVQIRDGVDGHMIAPAAIEQWERYGDANTTYGGAPTLYVLNASRSGSAMSYHTDPVRLKKETPDYGQVAAIFNDSHNESTSSGSRWIPPYAAWVAAVSGRLPNAAINVVGQNPHTSAWANEAAYGPEHVTRIMELSAAASARGWGYINVYQAYLDDPRGLGVLISADGLHPTPVGYALSGDTVAKAAGIV